MEHNKKMYESTVIINPTLEEHQIEGIIKNIEETVTKLGGSVKSTERWGRKRLSYPIHKRNNGYYAHFEFETENNIITDLERNFEYDDNVMRYLTIRLDAKMLEAKEQQKLKPREPEELAEIDTEVEEDVLEDDVEDFDISEPEDDEVEPSSPDEKPDRP